MVAKPHNTPKQRNGLMTWPTQFGCDITAVQVVPGNHDIDQVEISAGCGFLLARIAEHGEIKLDEFLKNDRDPRVTLRPLQCLHPFR